MSNTAIRRGLMMIGVAVLLGGCTIRHGDFTVISGKLVDTGNFNLGKGPSAKNVEGDDKAHLILGIPTKIPTLDAALDDACEKGGGDVMTDAVVEQYGWTLILYGQSGWRVTGDVVKTRD